MKISITPISVRRMFCSGNMGLKGFVDYCAKMEIDGIDLLDSNCYPWFWNDKQNEFKNISVLLRDSGLKLAAYATGNNFAVTDSEERLKNINIVKKSIREAAELEAPVLRIFGGYHKESGGAPEIDYSNGLEMVIDGIEKCLDDAEKNKIVLALENHGRLPGHSYEIKSIIKHFNSPWLKVMFDCGNFVYNGMDESEDPLRAYENLKEEVVHVHVKDMGPCISGNHRKIEGYVLGKGTVPLRQFAALLEENNYKGYCSLEHEASAITPDVHGVPQSIEYLKRIRAIHNTLQSK